MVKVKTKLKNLIYSIGFLFRPITTVAVSFIILALTSATLAIVIIKIDENSKAYGILLSILTGIVASILIAIMMELYNNYRFNTKRQRELRGYFRQIAGYELRQESTLKTDLKYGSDDKLGAGRAYVTFRQLHRIIPTLREALDNREYLYRKEIDEIDDILYSYDEIVKIISIYCFSPYLDLLTPKVGEGKEAGVDSKIVENDEIEEVEDPKLINEISLINYPELLNFLKIETLHSAEQKYDSYFTDEGFGQLESIIEKAIFSSVQVFNGFFQVTDSRYESSSLMDDENILDEELPHKKRRFEFRSNVISKACGDIDKSMIKLQKRLTKEPYIWVIASYK